MNIWWDSRRGGARVHDLAWTRCHFGVKNGYHSGADGNGCGRTILFQPAPAEHAPDGRGPSSGGVGDGTNGWLPSFDWSMVDHGASNISFTDCLMEYVNWYPMDVCDYARSFSVWQGNEPTRRMCVVCRSCSASARCGGSLMKLHHLRPAEGSKQKKIRVGSW